MTLFRNILIIDSQSPFNGQNKDILVENHIIKHIAPPFSVEITPEMTVVEIENACISVGWVDMQVHISEPGLEWKETLAQTEKAAQQGGFTTIVCYPETNPAADNASVIKVLRNQSKEFGVNCLFTGALTEHKAGKEFSELYEMHTEKAVAFTDGLQYPQSAGRGWLFGRHGS